MPWLLKKERKKLPEMGSKPNLAYKMYNYKNVDFRFHRKKFALICHGLNLNNEYNFVSNYTR